MADSESLPLLGSLSDVASDRAERLRELKQRASLAHRRELKDAGSLWRDVAEGRLDAVVKYFEDSGLKPADTRGALGQTVLHQSIASQQYSLARSLAEKYPQLVNLPYLAMEAKIYTGQTALHQAVIAKDLDLVRFLVEHQAQVESSCRAVGDFFDAPDKKTGTGNVYLGQSPLSFAACTNQIEIVKYFFDNQLVSQHALRESEDSNTGYTIMHLLVWHELPDMFRLLLEQYDADITVCDNNGQTPLLLAAFLGKKRMLDEILNMRKEVLWKFGRVTCTTMPLDEVDTVRELLVSGDASVENRGALELIVAGGHVDMMGLDIVVDLFQKKWELYAAKRFHATFAAALAFLITFAVSLSEPPGSIVSIVLDSLLAAAGIAFLIREAFVMHSVSLVRYIRFAGSMELCSFACVSLMLAADVLKLCRLFMLADALMAISVFCGSLFLLSFANGFTLTGPYVVMIKQMIKSDVARFCVIFSVVLFGFAQALCLCFVGKPQFHQQWGTLLYSISTLLKVTVGDTTDFADEFTAASSPVLALILFSVFVIFSVIVMLNLLIGTMGDTYNKFEARADLYWRMERARIIVTIEDRMTDSARLDRSNRIGHPPADSDDDRQSYSWIHEEKAT